MIKLFKYLFQNLKTKRFNVFVLFFVIAFSILIITKLSASYSNSVLFKVNLLSVPKDIVLINPEDLQLNVSMEATGFSWLNIVFNNSEIDLDLQSDFFLKEKQYFNKADKTIKVLSKLLSSRFKNITIPGESFVVNFDKLSSKTVPVKNRFILNFEDGFNTNHAIKTSPDSVKVIGPQSILERVFYINTEVTNFEKVSNSLKETIVLDTDSLSASLSLSQQTVKLNVSVETFTEGEVKIPIIINNLPALTTITFFPKEATVNYYVPLSLYNSIAVKDFKVVCNYNNISSSGKLLFPELEILNSEIKTARIKEPNIDFIITQE